MTEPRCPVEQASCEPEGMTLKEIGVRLTMEGYQTRDGGIWHPATVPWLLRTQEDFTSDEASPDLA